MLKKPIRHVKEKIRVTDYLDYREYLKQVYVYLKVISGTYSYLQFAEDLGFAPTNVIRLVIAGRRRLSAKSAATIAEHLELRNEERRYFLALVSYELANKKKRSQIVEKLSDLKKSSLPNEAEKVRMEYFSEWHHPIVRELIRVHGKLPTREWISQNVYPVISEEQLKSSIEVLTRLGFIVIDENTKELKALDDSPMILPSDATAGQLSITRYHYKMLELSKHAIESIPEEEREVNALTICVSTQTQEKIRERILELCGEVLAEENKQQEREVVVQVNIQQFALTRKGLKS